MTSIYFIPWTLAAGLLWKPHPADLGEAAIGLKPLSSPPTGPLSPFPPPQPNPSPPSQGLGQKPSPEEQREARGIGGQRELPQKNGDTGLSGEPEVTFTDLWVIESVRLAVLPVMAMSPERAK